MDPLAHTLFGAALAETGLKRHSRYATATLLIGANLPDVDVVAGLWGEDFELYARRGWTHGVLALVVLPVLLAAGVWLWHHWRWRASPPARGGEHVRRATDAPAAAPPVRPRALLALAYLAVLSHPLLDWLNTYGVRLLMPFDGRWFYGDTLFIIEPWFWLLTAAAVLMARSSTWHALAGWAVLALLTSALVLGTDMVPVWVKLVWCAGVLLLALARWRAADWLPADGLRVRTQSSRSLSSDKLARLALAMLVLYVGAASLLARAAESRAAARFVDARQVQANPAPGDPFSHRLVIMEPDRYRIIAADGSEHALPRVPPDAIVRAALADASVRGFTNWMRFPHWTVEEGTDQWVVSLQDLRYQGPGMPGSRGFGAVRVRVPKPD